MTDGGAPHKKELPGIAQQFFVQHLVRRVKAYNIPAPKCQFWGEVWSFLRCEGEDPFEIVWRYLHIVERVTLGRRLLSIREARGLPKAFGHEGALPSPYRGISWR